MRHPVPPLRRVQARANAWDWEFAGIAVTAVYLIGGIFGVIGFFMNLLSGNPQDHIPWLVDILLLGWALPLYGAYYLQKMNYRKGTPVLAFNYELDQAYTIVQGLSDMSREAGEKCLRDMKRIVQRQGSSGVKSEHVRKHLDALRRLSQEDKAMQDEIARQSINSDGLNDLENTIEAIAQARRELRENTGLLSS